MKCFNPCFNGTYSLTELQKATSMDETVKTEISDDMSLVKDEGIEAEFTELTDEGAEVENQQIEGQQVMDM